ncbi:hypothetical protein [Streptomyces goshikiensis]|uniref:hypothetical protein n=1 Tax=Streptomyces goshikiensis TaxID=1942 RepID=UPI003658CA7A
MLYAFFPSGVDNRYEMGLEVASFKGIQSFRGNLGIRVTQAVGDLELTIPRWQQEGPLDFVDIVTQDTQCSSEFSYRPPVVTSFRFVLPDGPEIIMERS